MKISKRMRREAHKVLYGIATPLKKRMKITMNMIETPSAPNITNGFILSLNGLSMVEEMLRRIAAQ